MVLTARDIPMLILRTVSVIAALVFFYMALFMYKDEADRWQNRLVDLWVEIGSGRQGFLSVPAGLVQKSSGFVTSWLTWLLGERPVSIQVVAVSLSLSYVSSMFCLYTVDGFILWSRGLNPADFPVVFSLCWLLFGMFGVRALCNRGKSLLALAITIALIALTCARTSLLDFIYPPSIGLGEVYRPVEVNIPLVWVEYLTGLAFGVLCDLFVLIVNRRVLRSMAGTSRTSILVLGFAYNLAWAVVLASSTVLFLHFWVIGWRGLPGSLLGELYLLPVFHSANGKFLFLLVLIPLTTNLFTLCASVGFLAIIVGALAHRLFWPLAERSVYALYQWKLFTNKKLQISAGIALLIFAFPGLHAVFALLKP
jgi:hypothetical protein